MQKNIKAWEEKVIIPTYEVGEPEKYPLFLEKRVYQGSSGRVYPFPVIEQVKNVRKDKEWIGLFLENDYLKIMILPELGGRVQMAFDKIRNRHFVYYNRVIKPALVGLAGPWISGGIEFNWPQHHRPGTYMPVDYCIREEEDGSKTIFVSEVERMYRTKGMAGFKLYPDKAYLEINVQLYNRMAYPQTFLWWANPAVKVNDHFQSVFPPDVNAVYDHGKRDVSAFPIASGTYYKVDYSGGVDISRYKNIPVPTSFMAVRSEYDFLGGYEHDTGGGILHVADHHISPGKKQWTWGNGDFGKAWERNLTDEDGPYIELMCGVYTDNQPDFSWLGPYEEKSFKQYFLPYGEVGLVKNATKDFLINLETQKHTGSNNVTAKLKAYSTGFHPECRLILDSGKSRLLDEKQSFIPGGVFKKQVRLPEDSDLDGLRFSILNPNGDELISWSKSSDPVSPVPEPASPAPSPDRVETNELLFLHGLHIEQYHHATFKATDYYMEALRRDPGDIRCNNAMGLWLMKTARFEDAEGFFRKAIESITLRNPNPRDGESLYNLGISLFFQDRITESYKYFYKSTWNAATMDAGYFYLSLICTRRELYSEGLRFIDLSLSRNSKNQKALHLKIILLRLMQNKEMALELIGQALEMDPFNFGVIYEKYLLKNKREIIQNLLDMTNFNVHSFLEYACDYGHAGRYKESIDFLDLLQISEAEKYPMVDYFKAWYYKSAGNSEAASGYFDLAGTRPPDYCFPNKVEEILALQAAVRFNENDPMALYYLGNYWYAHDNPEEAIKVWEASDRIDGKNPLVKRNLALAYFNKSDNAEMALEFMKQALRLNPESPRLLMEFDQLNKRLNVPPETRFKMLDENFYLVSQRDDLYLEFASLYNLMGEFETAKELIITRIFHPWEGGEGKVPEQYRLSLVEMAKLELVNKNYDKAERLLKEALVYPENLGEGKLPGTADNDINYFLGCTYEAMGDKRGAKEFWHLAATGSSEPAMPMYYNDNPPEMIFYQGIAMGKLEMLKEADIIFEKLIHFGITHIHDDVSVDYFAVSLPDLLIWEDDLKLRNFLHCNYMLGLGYLGLGNENKALEYFNEVLAHNRYHRGAIIHKQNLAEALFTV